MRIVPVLALLSLTACGTKLDPTFALREAGKRLRCTVEEVRPSLEPRLPLDRSFLRLNLKLGVENPSDVKIQVKAVRGTVFLDRAGATYRIGDVATGGGIHIDPRAKGTVALELQATYADLKSAWQSLSEAILRKDKATWRIEGMVTVDLLGLPLELPFRTTQESGR